MKTLLWFIVILWLGVSLEVTMARNMYMSDMDDCEEDQYLQNNICHDCKACPAGTQSTLHCGYTQTAPRAQPKLTGLECEPCRSMYFKENESKAQCSQCKAKCPGGKTVTQQCNATSDLQCGSCPKGYYESTLQDCVKCSFCCGLLHEVLTPTYQRNNVVAECKRQELGNYICSPLTNCKPPPPTPPITTTPTVDPHSTAAQKAATQDVMVQERRGKTTTAASATQTTELHSYRPKKGLHVGFVITIVIAIAFAATIGLLVICKCDICKKIKALIKPEKANASQVVSAYYSPASKRVGEYLAFNAEPTITNMAQRIYPEEDSHHEMLNETEEMHCACQHPLDIISSDDSDMPGMTRLASLSDDEDPEHAHECNLQNAPPTRGITGHYVHMVSRTEMTKKEKDKKTMCPGSEPLENQDVENVNQSEEARSPARQDQCSGTLENHQEDDEPKEEDEIVGDDGREEAVALSVPVTGAAGDKVIIATGHNGAKGATMNPKGNTATPEVATNCTCAETDNPTATDTANNTDNGKRSRIRTHKKKSKPLLDTEKEHLRVEESLRCTCGDCHYRPYDRENSQQCYCSRCSPHASDNFFRVIDQRNCLKETICEELNKKSVSNWRDIVSYMREDKKISAIQQDANPTDIVLRMLKAKRPGLKLMEFSDILKKITRHDVVHTIGTHHLDCGLCMRNSFDGHLNSYSL